MNMPSVMRAMLDVVLPRRPRRVLTESLSQEELCVTPKVHVCGAVHITSLLLYENAATEALIHSLKYDGSERAAVMLASVLEEYLTEELSRLDTFGTREPLIIPIPLHRAREHERGFNQMHRILSRLPKHMRDMVRNDILIRTRNTKPQTRLSRSERLQNVVGAFCVPIPQHVAGREIIVIDDVTTTGATLAEAARTLAEVGAQVQAVALARA